MRRAQFGPTGQPPADQSPPVSARPLCIEWVRALALRGMRHMRVGRGLGTILAGSVAVAVLVGTPPAAAAIPDFGTEPIADSSSAEGSSIVDVRVGENDGFDRFVVEFDAGIGAYFVSYVEQVTQDGSGDVVPVEGSAFLQVTMNGIPNEPPVPQQTIDVGLTGLIQVVGAGAGFEATVSYGLGTAQAAGFRAFTLTDPTRLVVDIAHPDVVPTATNTADPTAQTSAETSPSSGPEGTPSEASGDSDSSNSWLLYLVVGLVVFALVTGILGWRMRNSNPNRR